MGRRNWGRLGDHRQQPRRVRRRPAVEALEGRALLAATITEFPLPTANAQPLGVVTGSDGNNLGDTSTVMSSAVVAAAPAPVVTVPFVTSVNRVSGFGRPGVIVLGFNTALDPGTAQNPGNYTIIGLGPGGRLDTADDIAGGRATNQYLHIPTATYNNVAHTVTLTTYEPLSAGRLYLLIANGRPAHPTASGESPNGLEGPIPPGATTGIFLSGDYSGVPGSDFFSLVPPPGEPFVSPGTTLPPSTTTPTGPHALPRGTSARHVSPARVATIHQRQVHPGHRLG